MSLVADRILELGVARVRRNCRIALDTRPAHLTTQDALDLVHDLNESVLLASVESAQLVLDAEKPTRQPIRSTAVPLQWEGPK